jgi:aldehyde:ferredoxin oxidoreductase
VAGRGGIGAVLGAKNVKAVSVAGGRKTEPADLAALKALIEERREPMTTGTKALSTYGTPFLVKPINTLGALCAYNLLQEIAQLPHYTPRSEGSPATSSSDTKPTIP